MTGNDKHVRLAPPPPAVWRGLGFAAVGVLATVVLGIALISTGIFDPPLAGDLVNTYALQPITVAAGRDRQVWLEEPVIATDFTVRLAAALDEGELDSGYGLVVGNPAGYFAAAVSPLGYVTVWEGTASATVAHVAWQPWPHVQQGQSENEIQIDVVDNTVTVRVNRELLWEGSWQRSAEDTRAALYAESFGQPVKIAFRSLALYEPGD